MSSNLFSLAHQTQGKLHSLSEALSGFIEPNSFITYDQAALCPLSRHSSLEFTPNEQDFKFISAFQEMSGQSDLSTALFSPFSEMSEEASAFVEDFHSLLSSSKSSETHSFTFDNSECVSIKSASSPEKKQPKYAIQNNNRNSPLLILMRVKKGITAVLTRNSKYIPSFLKYIVSILDAYGTDRIDKEGLLEFLDRFDKKRKTWECLKDNLRGSGVYGKITLDCIDALLSESGEDDFNDWIATWRGKAPGRDALVKHKESNRQQFAVKIRPVVFRA